MSNLKILILVAGASIVTFFLSVLFSINMVFMTPNNLAEAIKKDPLVFMEAIKEAAQSAQKLSTERDIEKQMENKLEIKTKGRVTFGDPKASISVVEFSDFQCPYCSRASKNMKALIKKYKGKVNVVYKHFPLSFHPFAKPAAEYFEAIAMIDHGMAKKFHDYIFDNFEGYARLKTDAEITKAINKTMKKIGVNAVTAKANLPKAKLIVEADLEEGSAIGVSGTPNFFVNGINASKVGPEFIIEKILKTQ